MAEMAEDAREFGLHIKQGGWRLGLLVARNVDKGIGTGDNQFKVSLVVETSGKVSAIAFAKASGTSDHRVDRYLKAWERAAAAGHVPHAADLAPGADPDIAWKSLPDWETFYFSPVGRNVPEDRQAVLREQARKEGLGASKVIDVASNPKAVAAAMKADPTFAESVMEERETRGAALEAAVKAGRKSEPGEPSDRPRPAAPPTGIMADLAGIRLTLKKVYDLASHPTFDWGDSRATIPADLRQIAMQAEMVADAVENPNSVKFDDDEWAEFSR